MQITHLFVADLLWIALVLTIAETVALGSRPVIEVGPESLISNPAGPAWSLAQTPRKVNR
jgi:hypothetical protein